MQVTIREPLCDSRSMFTGLQWRKRRSSLRQLEVLSRRVATRAGPFRRPFHLSPPLSVLQAQTAFDIAEAIQDSASVYSPEGNDPSLAISAVVIGFSTPFEIGETRVTGSDDWRDLARRADAEFLTIRVLSLTTSRSPFF
jgi:hypothetical protein